MKATDVLFYSALAIGSTYIASRLFAKRWLLSASMWVGCAVIWFARLLKVLL